MNTSTAANTASRDQSEPSIWWREPFFWLVVGGPLIVVVAAIVTGVIAYQNQDTVIDRNDYQQELLNRKKAADPKELLDDLAKIQPANQARNHAASPVVPGLQINK